MAYWTYRDFDGPLKAGEEKCKGENVYTCYENRGYKRVTQTNLGGVLGVINFSNSIPLNHGSEDEDEKNIKILKHQMSQMQWDDETILSAMYLFQEKGYEKLVGELPNLTKKCEHSVHINMLNRLNLNDEIIINWAGGAVNGTFWLENKKGERILSCYVNFRNNSLSWDRDEQSAILAYLRDNGGRFLKRYLGE